ncbi:MAG TPA: thioesterase family protein [Chloroflexota bacterium]|nr:thioesterase family protein [Chloroflexota bacterium]
MKEGLAIGASAEQSLVTLPDWAITFDGPPQVSVLSTPALVEQLEVISNAVLEPYFETGEASVGTIVNVTHLAPTPIGMTITVRASVTAIDRRRVTFYVEAVDQREKIAEGIHERFVVDLARFAQRLANKNGKPLSL